MVQQMCIFAGCDYLSSLPGMGIRRAYSLIKQHRSFRKALRRLRLEGKVKVPADYEVAFERALLTFQHQRVFDPDKVGVDMCLFVVPLIPENEACLRLSVCLSVGLSPFGSYLAFYCVVPPTEACFLHICAS